MFQFYLHKLSVSRSITPVIIENDEVRKYPLRIQILRRAGKSGKGVEYYGFSGKKEFNEKLNKMEHGEILRILRKLPDQRGKESEDEVFERYCNKIYDEDKLKIQPMGIKRCKLFEDKEFMKI